MLFLLTDALLTFKACEAITQPGGLAKWHAVSVLGKQPRSSIWVLGPGMSINRDIGELLDATTTTICPGMVVTGLSKPLSTKKVRDAVRSMTVMKSMAWTYLTELIPGSLQHWLFFN